MSAIPDSIVSVLYLVTGAAATVVSFFILLSRKRSRMIGVKLAADVLWSANYFALVCSSVTLLSAVIGLTVDCREKAKEAPAPTP